MQRLHRTATRTILADLLFARLRRHGDDARGAARTLLAEVKEGDRLPRGRSPQCGPGRRRVPKRDTRAAGAYPIRRRAAGTPGAASAATPPRTCFSSGRISMRRQGILRLRIELMEQAGKVSVEHRRGRGLRAEHPRHGNWPARSSALDGYVSVPLAFHHPGGNWSAASPGAVTPLCAWTVSRSIGWRAARWTCPRSAQRAAAPSGKPNGLTLQAVRREPRPFAGIFPRSAPPASVCAVVDLRPLTPDRRSILLSLQAGQPVAPGDVLPLQCHRPGMAGVDEEAPVGPGQPGG